MRGGRRTPSKHHPFKNTSRGFFNSELQIPIPYSEKTLKTKFPKKMFIKDKIIRYEY